MEDQIKASLISLLSAIKSADEQTIATETARLDEFTERGRAGLSPKLVHLLQNRSYSKALGLLEGDAGSVCGCSGRKQQVQV